MPTNSSLVLKAPEAICSTTADKKVAHHSSFEPTTAFLIFSNQVRECYFENGRMSVKRSLRPKSSATRRTAPRPESGVGRA